MSPSTGSPGPDPFDATAGTGAGAGPGAAPGTGAGAGFSAGLDSLAEDAGRLIGAAQDWARAASADAARAVSNGACRWCPVCQLAASLHPDGPDLSAKLTAMMTSITELVVAAFEDRPDPTKRPAR